MIGTSLGGRFDALAAAGRLMTTASIVGASFEGKFDALAAAGRFKTMVALRTR